jgi:predicted nucleotidyltransferase
MVSRKQIKAYAMEVARQFKPERIILFGSYAYGKPTPDSDVDLLVVIQHRKRNPDKATEIRLKLRAPFPMDLLVRTPQRIQERLALGDFFIREIMTKGKVLYEGHHRGLGAQG